MKFSNFTRGLSPIEIALFVIFVVYLVFPFKTPRAIAPVIGSPLGLMIMFVVVVFLFFHTNPILGILYIFVAYELIRRSALLTNTPSIVKDTPTEKRRATQMAAMNPPKATTLEEEVVASMTPPRGVAMESTSTFLPVADRLVGVSMYA